MCTREGEVRAKLRCLSHFSLRLSFSPLSCSEGSQKFKGRRGQVAVRAGVSGSLGEERGSVCRQQSHNHASCVWFGTGSQDLSLCASQTFSQGYPIFSPSFHSLRRLLPSPDSQPHTNGLNKGPA